MNSHAIGVIALLAVVLSASSGGALTTDFSYDSAGRLVRADYDLGVSISYAHDLSGNLVQRQRHDGQVSFGRLQVTIVPATAQWRRASTALWRGSGDWEENVPAGTHTVAYTIVPGWNTQSSEEVIVAAGQSKAIAVNYSANSSTYPVVAAAAGGGGTISGGGTYLHNDLVLLTAQPGSGYRFLYWTEQDGSILSSQPSIEFRALSGRTLTAIFLPRSLPGVNLLLMED